MNKKDIKYLIYGLLLGGWIVFCSCELPELQAKQRQKIAEQEKQILEEMCTREVTYLIDMPVEINLCTPAPTQPPKEQVIEEVQPKYSDEDVQLLARLIESEGGIESYQCKLYIGSVVLNRLSSKQFPNTLYDVIYQVNKNGTHQFSVTITRKDGTKAIDCEPSDESLLAAQELLTNGTQLPEDVMVFYTNKCKGNWVNTRATYTQVDSTIFAYIYAGTGELK